MTLPTDNNSNSGLNNPPIAARIVVNGDALDSRRKGCLGVGTSKDSDIEGGLGERGED